MRSPSYTDKPDSLTYIARLVTEEAGKSLQFWGTGIIVAPQWILTCNHVYKEMMQHSGQNFSALKIKLNNSNELVSVDSIEKHNTHDLVALHTVSRIQAQIPTFIRNLKPILYRNVKELTFDIIGFESLEVGPTLVMANLSAPTFEARDNEWQLKIVQLNGNAKEGNSGGPVLIQHNQRTACIGMTWLGGSKSKTSQLIASEVLIEFLENELKIQYDDIIEARAFFLPPPEQEDGSHAEQAVDVCTPTPDKRFPDPLKQEMTALAQQDVRALDSVQLQTKAETNTKINENNILKMSIQTRTSRDRKSVV